MYKIVTDCAADLPREEAKAYAVEVAPLFIQFPEGEVSADEITPDEFYNRLAAMRPNIPSTAQPSAGIFAKIYQKLAQAGADILSIHISSGLSGTIDSARLGAVQAPEAQVTVVDSMTLSGGERFQVLGAIRGAAAGWSKDAILERLKLIREATDVIYTLETLEYLARGGRIGRVQALASSILKIKPVIHVDRKDGKYSTLGKTRTIPQSLNAICDHLVQEYGTKTPLWVCVLHGQFSEEAQALADLLKGKLNVAFLEILRISPVLGVHTGPGIVGAAIVPFELMSI
jgi:DegV family protein with EDD domain